MCSTPKHTKFLRQVLCTFLFVDVQVVYVGGRAIDHNPSFKLYLVTRNATPALTPDVVPLLTVTNFSITRSGLESESASSLARPFVLFFLFLTIF